MKSKISRKIIVDITLDSSETIMFSKGGQHKISLNPDILKFENDIGYDGSEVEITFQMERTQQERFYFIQSEALKHKERVENETKPT